MADYTPEGQGQLRPADRLGEPAQDDMRHLESDSHESDPESELPPLDSSDELEEEEPGISIDPASLLTRFDDDEGLDDEVATELDVGIELDAPPEDNAETEGELVLDIAALLNLADDEIAQGDPDETGPVDFDASAGIRPPPGDSLAGPAEDGTDEPLEDLVSDDLPELDADSEGDYDGEDAAWLELPDTRDEEPPPWASRHWRRDAHLPGAFSAVALAGGQLVAGGSELCWWPGNSEAPQHLGAAAPGIASLALVGPGFEAALLATTDHRLLRRFLGAREPQLVAGFGRVVGDGDLGTPRVELCQGAESAPDVVLARTSSGRLVRSQDAGETWSGVDVRARVIAMSAGGAPLALLGEDRTGLSLLCSTDTGLSWSLQPLDEAGRRVASGTAPLLAVSGPVVAIGDSARGLSVSTDGGASFKHVDGCAGLSALTAGELAGQVCVWAALYDEPNDHTHLVLVNPASALAERVAGIEAPGLDDEPMHEHARVAAMTWDAARQRLWTAGMAGLGSWAPPDSEDSDGTEV